MFALAAAGCSSTSGGSYGPGTGTETHGTAPGGVCNKDPLCETSSDCFVRACLCADGKTQNPPTTTDTCVGGQCISCVTSCEGHGGAAGACSASAGSPGNPGAKSDGGPTNQGDGGPARESISCQSDPTYCVCAAYSGTPITTGACGPSTLAEPGACCATSSWPSAGTCYCFPFTCDVNAGGGRDCWYHAGNSGHTTSATGAACCLKAGICSCYSAASAGLCEGYAPIGSCTAGVVAPCNDPVSTGDRQVAACH